VTDKALTLDTLDDIAPEHQPFAFVGGQHAHVGVLCIHGFTGTPAEMRPLGEYLAKKGYTVRGMLLPGHGALPERLKGYKWQQWAGAAKTMLEQLAQQCQHVFLAGESMGGLISLHLATHHPKLIKGVVSLATPSAINDGRAKLVRFAKYIVPYHYPLKDANFNDPNVRKSVAERMRTSLDLNNPRVVKQIQNSVRIPLDAIAELMALNDRVVKELPEMRAPVIFMQGAKDATVAPNSMKTLCAISGSKDKQTLWLENSGHVLPLEPDAHIVFYATEQFVQKRLAFSDQHSALS
jgi:carboxylesterase